MKTVEKGVFLSYRRTNASWALVIYKDLVAHGFRVFFDYSSIASGAFERVIEQEIRACAHFLVVLTPSALERCADPNDLLRREIETAIDSRRNVIPLMLERFDFNAPGISNGLVGKLAQLKEYNGMSVTVEYFDAAMKKLRDTFLNVPLNAVLHPLPTSSQSNELEQKALLDAASHVLQEELTAQLSFERGSAVAYVENAFADMGVHGRALSDAKTLKERASLLYHEGDLKGALQHFDDAIRMKPDYAEAFLKRANVRLVSGDLEGAQHDYNETIRLRPEDSEAFINRSVLLAQRADVRGALRDSEEALRLQPADPIALNNRGVLRRREGDLNGALQDYTEAIGLKSDYSEAFNNRGNVRRLLRDLDGALQDYNDSIRIDPTAEALVSRAFARWDKEDLHGAVRDFEEALRLQPGNATAIRELKVLKVVRAATVFVKPFRALFK
jgi:tetratricopeptide (TPR) repeat protein